MVMAAINGEFSAVFSADLPGTPRGGAARDHSDPVRDLFDAHIGAHGGELVAARGDAILARFASMAEAVQCAVGIRGALAGRALALPRFGVAWEQANLTGPTAGPAPGGAADQLRRSAAPGELRIAPTLSRNTTLRRKEAGVRADSHSRLYVLAAGALQFGGLIGYFLVWYALIVWVVYQIVHHGSSCWPSFLCDGATPRLMAPPR